MVNNLVFSVKDVAYLLEIPQYLVYKLINIGALKAYMNTRKEGYRITKEDFKEYCETREVNFDKILEKYYKENNITIPQIDLCPQDNNSILGYPSHPYHTYSSPNFFYPPTHSPENKEEHEEFNIKKPCSANPHNSLYSMTDIAKIFSVAPDKLYRLLELLGFIYKQDEIWYPTVPLLRFGLMKYDAHKKETFWTYIGKHFISDQLLFEVGLVLSNSKYNDTIIDRIIKM